MSRVAAVVRWRLVTTVVSLRLVPPAAALLVYCGLLAMGRQDLASVVAADAVVLFGLAVWIGLAHTSALAPGHRAITQVATGPGRAFAGDALAGLVLVAVPAAVVLAVPLTVNLASGGSDPLAGLSGPLALAGGYGAVLAAGVAGLAAALVVDALGVRPPIRFVAAAVIVALTLARPALVDDVGLRGVVAAVATPAVVDVARHAGTGPPGGLVAASACAAWAAGAGAVAAGLRRRRAPLDGPT